MLNFQKKITPYNRTKLQNKKNEYIVIHYVGAVSTAKNNVDYYASKKLGKSASYFVDEKSIWQCVEDSDAAWHCGGKLQGSGGHKFYGKCTNNNSIGVEMCCKKTASGQWYFEDETVKNTVHLVRYLMGKHNIPIEKVIRHYDVTGKNCPEPYINEARWSAFKKMITEGAGTDMEKFNDIKGHWAEKQINEIAQMGIVNGRPGGKFCPNDNITRAEAAVMIRNVIRYILGK